MARSIVECVPNFSEGRNPAVIEAIAAAIKSVRGVMVLDRTMDADHHRSVITFAAPAEEIVEAAMRGAERAVALIDLRQHAGVHPRIGAVDVVPFVPVEGITLAGCALLAVEFGERLWRELGVPVYLYEAAARREDRVRLENIRRGGFEGLLESSDPERRPDIGGPALHPSAGATAAGARHFLIAWNVNLASSDVQVAKAIARKIRTSSGGLECVKALGLDLESRGQTQVSMNLTDFDVTPPHVVYEAIAAEAAKAGVEIVESELIGLIPRRALEGAGVGMLRIADFTPERVLENRLETLAGLGGGIDRFTRTAGSGASAAAAGAMAAAVGAMVVGAMLVGTMSRFEPARRFFVDAIDRDAQAYRAMLRDGNTESVLKATRVALEIAREASALQAELLELRVTAPIHQQCDVDTALALAQASGKSACALAMANLRRLPDGDEMLTLAATLATLEWK